MANDDAKFVRNTTKSEHSLSLIDRKSLTIHGVLYVDSFDHHEVIVATELGTLTIKGKDMRIKQLDLEQGVFIVEGSMDSFSYTEGTKEKPSAKNFIGRILR